MGKRVRNLTGSGVAVEGTGERELQPLDGDEIREKRAEATIESQEARVKRAPVILASAPPLSSGPASPPRLDKPAPPPVHAGASWLPSLPPPGVLVYSTPGALREEAIRQLLAFRDQNTGAWGQLVGWYFQTSGRSPSEVIGGPTAMWAPAPCGWERDLRRLDLLDQKAAVDVWQAPAQGTVGANLLAEVGKDGHKRPVFEAAVGRWARNQANATEVSQVLRRAGWIKDVWDTDAWRVMHNLKTMDEGPIRERMLAQAKAESPRFYQQCMDDENCGR